MRNSITVFALSVVATLSAFPWQSAAASTTTTPTTQPATFGPEVEQWIVRPSPASDDSLQYSLLPNVVDQTPGNAVPLYLLARRYWPDQKTTDEVLEPENSRFDYLDTPIDQFPQKYSQRLLNVYADTLTLADRAARRRSATWDDDWPDPALGAKALEYRDDLRHISNLLGFRARYEVSQGHWFSAVYTMQTAFSMAKQMGSSPLLIHAIEEEKFAEEALASGVSEWIERGNSPNLYWALSGLPDPFVEFWRIPLIGRVPVGSTLLDQAQRGEAIGPQQWADVMRQMIQNTLLPLGQRESPAEIDARVARLVFSAYPPARQYLISTGETAARIEVMPPEQVVGRYLCLQYRQASRDLWKSYCLPYPQAQAQMLRSWQTLAPDRQPLVNNPLFQLNEVWDSYSGHPDYRVPSMLHWRYLLSVVDRRIALLRTIEALRDYAAHHDGRPPQRLDQLTDLPLPPDPITGKPFDYSIQGQTVHLQALTPWWPSTGWKLELTFEK